MFPWFICLLSTPPYSRTLPGLPPEPLLWWNPVEPSHFPDGFLIQEGDILMPAAAAGDGTMRNAIRLKDLLWEDGVIPFEFGRNFTRSEQDLILHAMAVLEGKTCVRFVEKTNQRTFVSFRKENNGCFAPIGRLPGNMGPLPVNLQSPECFSHKGIIEHELLHVTGLFHEHSRPDRDDFVTVHWCNVDPFRLNDFRKGTPLEMTTFDLPYDYSSIMHYPRWAFSRNGRPTITAKAHPNMTLGQREGPTLTDFEKVLRMYNCDGVSRGNPPAS